MEWKKALSVTDLDERKVVKIAGHKILFIKQKDKLMPYNIIAHISNCH